LCRLVWFGSLSILLQRVLPDFSPREAWFGLVLLFYHSLPRAGWFGMVILLTLSASPIHMQLIFFSS
jgi:hypothetical protein